MDSDNVDDRRVGRILHYASWLFVTVGYEKATMERVAMDAGVGKPTIYAFFKSKNRLLASVLESTTESLDVQIPIQFSSADPQSALRQFAMDTLSEVSRHHRALPSIVSICRLAIAV